MQKMTYAQFAASRPAAKSQAIMRSMRVKRILRPRAKRIRMPVTAINKANTENRSGLYSHAWSGWPLNIHNTPRVNPQVGHGR